MDTKKGRKKPREEGISSNTLLATWRTNIFKITSIVVVLIFVLIIAAGLIREYYPSPSAKPTESQILAAKTVVASALQSEGDALSNYRFVASDRIRHLSRNEDSKRVLEVSAYNNMTRHTYLIDMDSNGIVVHSQVDFYGNITGTNEYDYYCDKLNPCHLRYSERH